MGSHADQILKRAGVAPGDRIRISTASRADEGVLMPSHAFSGRDVVILKLDSGYNIGLMVGPDSKIAQLAGAPSKPSKRPVPQRHTQLPAVAILGTGGTIASYVDYRTGAVHPAATATDLVFATPELAEIADIRAEVVFQQFSEDVQPQQWLELARRVKAAFDDGARGVVVPHGTDTLSYTAAALAFLIRRLPGPVVLVGSQRSSDRPSSDAPLNLTSAVRVAAHADLAEVVICMHENADDDRVAIHRGVRVRKNHSTRRDAFQSVNAPPLGYVKDDEIFILEPHRPRPDQGLGCEIFDAVADDVALVYSYPGLTADALERMVPGRGLVLAGTGLGHVPRSTFDAIDRLIQRGVLIVMTTQCLRGRVNLNVYSTGRDLLQRGVIPMEDALPEVAFAKLAWALGNAKDVNQARAWMNERVADETHDCTYVEARLG